MQIAVLSDSHDNLWKLEAALPHLQSSDAVIHCGDICSPFMIRGLGEGLSGIPLHVVWGNNDGDEFRIAKVAQGFPSIHLHGEMARLSIGDRTVGVNHYPELARGLAATGEYDLVCYGHDHLAHSEELGGTLLLNPGELMGMKGRSSLALIDAENLRPVWIDL
jgi:putative phosphoesterase